MTNLSNEGEKQEDEKFFKSSASESQGCVEVALLQTGIVKVRDSKNRDGPVLTFNTLEWTAFITGVARGEFDLRPGVDTDKN